MTKFKIYKLRFTTPLHIGDERADYGISLQTIHSDTLYAAMTAVLAKIGMKIPDNGDLGFTISSLFPYYEKDIPVYFLPKLKLQQIPPKSLQNEAKKIKKIEWIDLEFFNKLINGEPLFDNHFKLSWINGKYLSHNKIDKDFISKEVNPRVQVSRDFSKDAEPFYMERLYFKEKSGMYFIAMGDTTKIDLALKILKDEGIGTDRTIGNGFFEFEKDNSIDQIELKLPRSSKVANLSLFLPENQNQLSELLDDENIAYNFQKRGGWITDSGLNTFRKNTVQMFREASVFSQKELKEKEFVMGDIVDLKPDISFKNIEHPIWRTGKSIFIPVKL